jgi:hypothetical protein
MPLTETPLTALASGRTRFDRRCDGAELLVPSRAPSRTYRSAELLEMVLQDVVQLLVETFEVGLLGKPGPFVVLGNAAAPTPIKLLHPQLRLGQ